MKLQHITLWIACTAALFSAVAVAGTPVYKWTDRQGVVHYSDKAPTHSPQNVKVLALPELPPVDPQAVKQEQAYIASVNQWYQEVMDRQLQWRNEQLMTWQPSPTAQSATPASTTEVTAVSPLCWDCGQLWHRPYYRPPNYRRPQPKPSVFKSNIWSTQPNPYTQQLYHP